MLRLAVILFLAAPGIALAQSSPINGPTGGAVHGQNWNMRQDLASPTPPGGVPLTRTQRMRQQATSTAARQRAARQRGQPPR
jgi:hypothetical protein